jgi:hypothetical protein
MKYFKKYIFVITVILFVSGCTVKEQVRVDIDSFMKDQASYIDKDVVITAVLEDVISRYSLYRGKKIEITAPFNYFGSGKFWTWHIMLKKDENTLRCYARHYRIKASNDALRLLRRARSKKEPITVTGVLHNDGIDIEKIYYDGTSIRPDMVVPGVFSDDINFLPRR